MNLTLRIACSIGTTFEFLEFQMFAMLLPFMLGNFYNPALSTTSLEIKGYQLFALAFLARPLGGLLLGYLADHYGRRQALMTAIIMMASGTLALALLPTYAFIGAYAGILLILCRVLQGLSLGGEFATGSVLLFENRERPKCIDLIWQDLGGTTGLLLATALVGLLPLAFSGTQIHHYAWRLPFLGACVLSLGGLYLRSQILNPHTHVKLLELNQARKAKAYYAQVFSQWHKLLLLSLACAANGVFWYLGVIFVPQHILPFSTLGLLGLISLTLFMIPIAASTADRLGAYRIWIGSTLSLVLNFIFLVLSPNPALGLCGCVLQAVLLAFNQGPRLMLLNSNFPLEIRALSCSLIYSLANIVGGLTPWAALALMGNSHLVTKIYPVVLVPGGLALASMGYLAWQSRSSRSIPAEKFCLSKT